MAPPKRDTSPKQRRRAARKSEAVWVPVLTGALISSLGLLSFLARQPWIFASLGPSAFLHAMYPSHPESTFRNTVVGHFVGIASGLIAVFVFGATDTPDIRYAGVRILAASLAVALTALGQILLRTFHTPGASTALLIALGLVAPTLFMIVSLASGVLLLAGIGEVIRYLRLRQLEM